MDMEVLSHDDNRIRFVLKGVTPALLNTIRRAAVSEVPVMAIDEVQFTKNSSVLYDEMVALRMGLIPLKTPLKDYNLPEECKCKGEGCSGCQVKLTLAAKGPCTVYSGDFKSKDPNVVPIYDNIPIVKLTENQEIKVTAVAVLGKGKVHSKWSAGHMYYQNYPSIKIEKGKISGANEIVASCPKNVLEVKDGGIKVKDINACNLCMACQDVAGKDKIEVSEEADKFIVTLESWGQLAPKEILSNAIEILGDKFKEFGKLVK